MTGGNEQIRAAYNAAALPYREKYDRIPPRADAVDATLAYCEVKNPNVLEIGCAYGREAAYILTKTDRYTGIDISDEYIKMAQTELPHGTFVRADVLEYDFPTELDVIFAFASLLHLDREQLRVVFEKAHTALNENGVLFLSLKRKDEYGLEVETDEYGTRTFYFYNARLIQEIAAGLFVSLESDEQDREVAWFTIILRKV
jgi:Trans-aconitate methyltransferase